MGYVPYDEALTEKARENRRNPTPAEKKLWFEVLRSRQLSGLKFTCQKPLDRYIVDFYCAELMLAIEIDGDSHVGRKRCDEVKTRSLNALGVEVVRYTNADVMNRVDGVYVDLLKCVSDMRTLSPPCRTPQPPLSGSKPTEEGGFASRCVSRQWLLQTLVPHSRLTPVKGE